MIVSEKGFVANTPKASVTLIVKLDVPTVVGIPLNTPAADRLSPFGSVPELTDHVSGAVPPDAAIDRE
jgi:hypothetical protein